MIDSGGITTRVRFWAAPTIASPDPRRTAATMRRHQREGRRQRDGDPDALEHAGDDEGQHGCAGSTAGRSRIPEPAM